VAELVRRRVGGSAGLADYLGPVTGQEAAAVEVGQHDVVIGGRQRRVVGVLLIGQRLIAEIGNRVGQEDGADAERRSRRWLAGRGDGERRRQDGERNEQRTRVAHRCPRLGSVRRESSNGTTAAQRTTAADSSIIRDRGIPMNWLFKEEPTHYGYDELVKDKKTVWSGVKNPLAQKHLRSVKKGDQIFYYHTGDEKAVVGIAKALGDAYPDPDDKSGKASVVDVAPVKKLPRPVTLAEIKADKAFADFPLVRISRL